MSRQDTHTNSEILIRVQLTVRVEGANKDGAWRAMVTICELIDPRPYKNLSPVYERLIYTVIYMSDRLMTQANQDLHLPPSPELRRSIIT
jgi:hypothetical protein